MNAIQEITALNEILDKHSTVFSAELGCTKGPAVELRVDEKAQPKFHKPRTVPFMLRETELQRLEKEGIISPVKFSKMGCPYCPCHKEGWEHQNMWGFQGYHKQGHK